MSYSRGVLQRTKVEEATVALLKRYRRTIPFPVSVSEFFLSMLPPVCEEMARTFGSADVHGRNLTSLIMRPSQAVYVRTGVDGAGGTFWMKSHITGMFGPPALMRPMEMSHDNPFHREVSDWFHTVSVLEERLVLAYRLVRDRPRLFLPFAGIKKSPHGSGSSVKRKLHADDVEKAFELLSGATLLPEDQTSPGTSMVQPTATGDTAWALTSF